jgi:hypothetical protein
MNWETRGGERRRTSPLYSLSSPENFLRTHANSVSSYLGDPGGDYYHDSPNKRSDISIRQGVPCDKMTFHNLIDFMATLIFQYSLIGASLEALW